MGRISEAVERRLHGPGALKVLQRLSYFRPMSAERRQLADKHVALFDGDLPRRRVPPFPYPMVSRRDPGDTPAGRYRDNFITMPDYVADRPMTETVDNLLYAPGGIAWHQGAACEEYSTGVIVRAEHMLPFPKKAQAKRIPEGTIIQCQHGRTWGDFVSEQVKGLVLCRQRGVPFPEPVVLPGRYAQKSYVRPQLDRLGIRYIFADTPILIERATVILKQSYSVIWTPEGIEAWRTAYGIDPVQPEPNSITYLSRLGVESELHTDRSYGSEATGRIVEDLGGRVVETAKCDFDDFGALAPGADIIIADHGSALFNMLQWRTRAVIEIVSDDWWDPNFTFFGVSMGIEDHVTIRGDGLSEDALREKLTHHIGRLRR
ncbi:MAG: hypothetical protein AAFQ39_15770 [Pseudomonadota bacterium]